MAHSPCPECGTPLPPDGVCAACLRRAAGADQGTTRTATSAVLERPAQIGPYKILDTLGEGGMGIVYLAEQERPLRRRVALKVIKVGMDTRQVVARFEAERQALAIMDHPNIAQVHDAGATEDGRPFFVMDHVPGIPITEYCDKHRLSTRARLELFVHVCSAVQHAHQKGVIHRDIKPSNILVMVQDGKPVPKVIDFGVAKAVHQRLTEKTIFTELGLLIGTPEYMSPEQAEMSGLNVDTTTDIYSLGVLLYELLVGELPFDGTALRAAGYAEIQRVIRYEEPLRPSTRLSCLGRRATDLAKRRHTDVESLARQLRGDLDSITLKAMEKDRTRRYPSASELAADVMRHLDGDTVSARPAAVSYRLAKILKKYRLAVSVSALFLATLASALAITAVMYFRGETARREAERQAYAAAISAADASLMAAESIRATRGLLQTAPFVSFSQEAERQLSFIAKSWRGWEWRYLARKLDASRLTLWGVAESGYGYGRVVIGPSESFSRPRYRGYVAFSSEGRELRWATDQGIHSWELANGQFIKAWPAQGMALAMSEDASALLSVDSRLQRPWRIVDITSGLPYAILDEPDTQAFREAAISPQGTYLATVGADNTLTIWKSGIRQSSMVLPSIPRFVRFGLGSRLLIVGVGTKLAVWALGSGAPATWMVSADGGTLIDGDLSSDGRTVVTVDDGGSVRWWQISSSESFSRGQRHTGATAVALTPNATVAATGARDGTVKLWEPRDTGAEVALLDPHDGRRIDALRFRPTGGELVVASARDGLLRIWNTNEARLSSGMSFRRTGNGFAENIADGGSKAIVTEFEKATLIDLETLNTESVGALPNPVIKPHFRDGKFDPGSFETAYTAASVSHNGDLVLLAKPRGVVLTWQAGLRGGLTILAKDLGYVSAVALSPNGRLAAVAFRLLSTNGQELPTPAVNQLGVWDTSTRQMISRVSIKNEVAALEFTKDGLDLIATPRRNPLSDGCDGVAQVWRSDLTLLFPDLPGCPVLAAVAGERVITYSPLDGRIRVSGRDGIVQGISEPLLDVRTFAVDAGGVRLAAWSPGGIDILELKALRRLIKVPTSLSLDRAQHLKFSSDGARLIALDNGRVQILYANPAHDPDVQTVIRTLLGDSRIVVSRKGPYWIEDLVERVMTDQNVGAEIRGAVVDELRRVGDRDVVALCNDSREIAVHADQTSKDYQRAVRNATRASELIPWSAHCLGVLGVARFRVHDYVGAMDAFEAAKSIRWDNLPTELAFKAMALRKLGREDEARTVSDEFRRVFDPSVKELSNVATELALVVPPMSVLRPQ
jgi:serine/threonine protein kinase/WD40 repeat protein